MKSKKLQIAVLSVLLVAVPAAGIFYLSGGFSDDRGAARNPQETENGSGVAGTVTPFDMSDLKPMKYEAARQITEDPLQRGPDMTFLLGDVFFYENQFCCFTYREGMSEEDFSVEIVSAAAGGDSARL